MEVFDRQGHEVIAEAMFSKTYYLALADVENGWNFGEEPVYDGETAEIFGFVAKSRKMFVVETEDENAEIEHKDKFYNISKTPTNKIFISFKQRGTPINERTIRQHLLVTNITPNEGAENQLWWENDETNRGEMKKIVAENISPKKINIGSSETLSWILVF